MPIYRQSISIFHQKSMKKGPNLLKKSIFLPKMSLSISIFSKMNTSISISIFSQMDLSISISISIFSKMDFFFIRYEGQWQIDCATHLALKNTSGNVLQTDVITRFVQWMFVGLMWHQEPGHLLHQCGRPPSLAGQPLQGLPKIQGHSVRQWQQKWLGAGFTGIRTSSLSAVGDRGGGWL